jgi:putative two-component system response regulator
LVYRAADQSHQLHDQIIKLLIDAIVFDRETEELSAASLAGDTQRAIQLAKPLIERALLITPSDSQQVRLSAVNALIQSFHVLGRAREPQDGVRLVEVALDLCDGLAEQDRLSVMLLAGEFEIHRNNVAAGLVHIAHALDLARRCGLPVAEARAWAGYGLALQSAGLHQQADVKFQQALQVLQHLSEPKLCANIWAWRVQLKRYDDEAEFALARHGCERALHFARLVEASELDSFVCFAYCNWAALELLRGQIDEAKSLLTLASAGTRISAQQRWMIDILRVMIAIHQDNSAHHRAQFEKLVQPENAPPRIYVIDALSMLASLYAQIGESELAVETLTALARERAQAFGALVYAPLIDSHSTSDTTRSFSQGAPVAATRAMLERVAVTAELRDDETGKHCFRVGRLAGMLASKMGLSDERSSSIELAARLHDIGKVAIPDAILLKPGRQTASEMRLMQDHTRIGADLLLGEADTMIQSARLIARHHHEWWNGAGYPDGLSGESIPLEARVTALADVFDALIHVRPYKVAWSLEEAISHIENASGAHFDPELTLLFVMLIREGQGDWPRFYNSLEVSAQLSPFVRAQAYVTQAHDNTQGR